MARVINPSQQDCQGTVISILHLYYLEDSVHAQLELNGCTEKLQSWNQQGAHSTDEVRIWKEMTQKKTCQQVGLLPKQSTNCRSRQSLKH